MFDFKKHLVEIPIVVSFTISSNLIIQEEKKDEKEGIGKYSSQTAVIHPTGVGYLPVIYIE